MHGTRAMRQAQLAAADIVLEFRPGKFRPLHGNNLQDRDLVRATLGGGRQFSQSSLDIACAFDRNAAVLRHDVEHDGDGSFRHQTELATRREGSIEYFLGGVTLDGDVFRRPAQSPKVLPPGFDDPISGVDTSGPIHLPLEPVGGSLIETQLDEVFAADGAPVAPRVLRASNQSVGTVTKLRDLTATGMIDITSI